MCCQLDLVSRVGDGIPCSGHGLFNVSTLVWCASVVLIKFIVCGQTRGSGAAHTAVTILGRRCVLGAEPSKWFDSVRVELHTGVVFASLADVSKLRSHVNPLKMFQAGWKRRARHCEGAKGWNGLLDTDGCYWSTESANMCGNSIIVQHGNAPCCYHYSSLMMSAGDLSKEADGGMARLDAVDDEWLLWRVAFGSMCWPMCPPVPA
jgi:hypothetical protein